MAIADLRLGLMRPELWWTFAVHDIRQRFRRSVLGPFWITLSMGIMVAALGLVYSKLFKMDISRFLPYLATGLIFWGFITSAINESCNAFSAAEGYIRNVPMPLSVHLYRVVARNGIVWVHNMAIYVALIFLFGIPVTTTLFLEIPGIVLLLINVAWVSMIAGVLSTRFRDIPLVISNLLQVIFFVTPIIWAADSLPGHAALVQANPFYHWLEIVRAPLLGAAPKASSWLISISTAMVGIPLAIRLYRRAYARIPYWV